ncbi:MAG: DNA repair protein RecN [Firmicutes bacterium]|nr:DNA repair protein RecN [Bacillota bacterium]
MLLELRVSNYALIDDLNLTFSPGLNILSGETGAGKSIVIGALNLLLGERATVDQIRQGEESAFIEGIVDCQNFVGDLVGAILDSAGIKREEELILAREIYRSGRGVARVNGRTVPVSFLKELGQVIVDLHGQHQHQSLLRPEKHIDLLDSFGGDKISSYRERLSVLYKKRQELKKELKRLGENSAERERRIDICSFQLKEIRSIDPLEGEDEELASREKVLANAEKLCTLVSQVYGDIYSGEEEGSVEALVDRLSRSLVMLSEAAEIDQRLLPLCELISGAAAQIEEASHELRDYQFKIEYEPGELAIIQERLNLINSLKKKYGSTITAVFEFANGLEQEIERLINSEAIAEKVEAELNDLDREIESQCLELRAIRRETAAVLENMLEENLKELALPGARFAVDISEKELFTPLGKDHVEFLFSANRGEEVKPLAKIISGGEVSRVMLALKTILARQDLVPTLIFDEVDSGVGGATIQAVAEKLAGIAQHHQVMCVTHSPQIASMSDFHYHLFKETIEGRTVTRAEKLTGNERREELARMLDGAGIDEVSLKHVDNLLERASRFRESLTVK